LDNYWRQSGILIKLNEILEVDEVKFSSLEICSDMNKILQLTDVGKIQVSDVCKLKKMLTTPDI